MLKILLLGIYFKCYFEFSETLSKCVPSHCRIRVVNAHMGVVRIVNCCTQCMYYAVLCEFKWPHPLHLTNTSPTHSPQIPCTQLLHPLHIAPTSPYIAPTSPALSYHIPCTQPPQSHLLHLASTFPALSFHIPYTQPPHLLHVATISPARRYHIPCTSLPHPVHIAPTSPTIYNPIILFNNTILHFKDCKLTSPVNWTMMRLLLE